jgi:hypothetical protein
MRFFAALVISAVIAVSVAGCETARVQQPPSKTSTAGSPTRPAPVRVRSTFTEDEAGIALTKYVYPNGELAARDAAHTKDVKDFLTQKNLNVSITLFLKSETFAADRATLARQLKLIP